MNPFSILRDLVTYNVLSSPNGGGRAVLTDPTEFYGPNQQGGSTFSVYFDEDQVGCLHASGNYREINWYDMKSVTVETMERRKWGTRKCWWLRSKDDYVWIPDDAYGIDELLARLQTLGNFDSSQLHAAIQSKEDSEFICWQRPLSAHTSLR